MIKRLLKSLRQSVQNPFEKEEKKKKGNCKVLCAKAQSTCSKLTIETLKQSIKYVQKAFV